MSAPAFLLLAAFVGCTGKARDSADSEAGATGTGTGGDGGDTGGPAVDPD